MLYGHSAGETHSLAKSHLLKTTQIPAPSMASENSSLPLTDPSHITRTRQQKLATGQRVFTRPSPCLVATDSELDTRDRVGLFRVPDLVLCDCIRYLQLRGRTSVGVGRVGTVSGSVGGGLLDKVTELTQTFEEGDHACVEAAVDQHPTYRKIAR